VSLLLVVFAFFCCPSSAGSANIPKNSIYVFSGRYTSDNMGDTLKVFKANYEKNHVLAAAYNRNFLELKYGLHLGGEIGWAYRFGTMSTEEIWSGLVIGAKGFTSREGITIGLALTVGVSLVNKTMGEEIQREKGRGGNASFLFYLGPELIFSFPGLRHWEFFYRLHHRSGAGGLLGGLYEGYNANTLGLRYRF
jgi:hypothetical protein